MNTVKAKYYARAHVYVVIDLELDNISTERRQSCKYLSAMNEKQCTD